MFVHSIVWSVSSKSFFFKFVLSPVLQTTNFQACVKHQAQKKASDLRVGILNYFFLAMKWFPIAAKIVGLIGILQCFVLNDFFHIGVWTFARFMLLATINLCMGNLVWFPKKDYTQKKEHHHTDFEVDRWPETGNVLKNNPYPICFLLKSPGTPSEDSSRDFPKPLDNSSNSLDTSFDVFGSMIPANQPGGGSRTSRKASLEETKDAFTPFAKHHSLLNGIPKVCIDNVCEHLW